MAGGVARPVRILSRRVDAWFRARDGRSGTGARGRVISRGSIRDDARAPGMAPRARAADGQPAAGTEGVGVVAGAAVDRAVPLGRVLRPDPRGDARRRRGHLAGHRGGAGGLLATCCFIGRTAMWGMTTGRPLGGGRHEHVRGDGATWVPGAPVAGCGGRLAGGLDRLRDGAQPARAGLASAARPELPPADPRRRTTTPGALFLVASLLWCFAAAFVGRYLVRIIAALMNVFPIVPALMLGGDDGPRLPRPARVPRGRGVDGRGRADASGAPRALVTVQMIFGFFATSGLVSVDWGTVARDAEGREGRGLGGRRLASWVVATLAILTTAARSLAASTGRSLGGPLRYTAALESLVGGRSPGPCSVDLRARGAGARRATRRSSSRPG